MTNQGRIRMTDSKIKYGIASWVGRDVDLEDTDVTLRPEKTAVLQCSQEFINGVITLLACTKAYDFVKFYSSDGKETPTHEVGQFHTSNLLHVPGLFYERASFISRHDATINARNRYAASNPEGYIIFYKCSSPVATNYTKFSSPNFLHGVKWALEFIHHDLSDTTIEALYLDGKEVDDIEGHINHISCSKETKMQVD